ncbi:hypothetical protein FQR65_LT13050 [Abscondita terminalis]|nr:hypothetical protein FQR65_LT13050 [Abscondita terminalis]
MTVEVLRRFDNQFKPFGVIFSYKLCNTFDRKLMGMGSYSCGELRCPIKKDVRQSFCNWTPDYSHLPPYFPEGEYNVIFNVTYDGQFFYSFDIFSTVYRKVKIPN